jgi:tRNA nucleotidyltransferase (CCA-adding enzyme)
VKSIILGHAGADFDCVASIAGLSRLYTGAVAILPTSVEPNVEEFLRLYEGRFRFSHLTLSALRNEEFDTAILADTIVPARLGEYRRILDRTPLRIIAYDHHELQEASLSHIDEGHIRSCGATASIVTAALRDQRIPVNPDEATLLALGIYEDTGSMLFPETTPFDVEQAAYLLKAGANLSTVSRFVTTYLSAAQQRALESALGNVSIETVAGARVAFSVVSAGRNVGNLSVIVHRLAQIVKADAVFFLYETPQALYVLGRSERLLNVAALLTSIGGAGRRHAATAVLKDGTTSSQARDLLMHSIQADASGHSSVVEQIMTPQPISIGDDRSADEALHTMINMGFSVLPVRKGDTIVGTVAKKTLEKASLAHLQQKSVHYFLNARVPSISPDATTEEIISAFSAYNAGLLLVMDAATLRGVLSRSDMLRYLNASKREKSPVEVSMSRVIAPSDLDRLCGTGTADMLKTIGRIGELLENRAYLVGGSVRDLLLGHTPHDLDIVTEKDVTGVAEAVAEALSTKAVSYGRFMTYKVHAKSQDLDFAAARLEYYDFPGSLPVVAPASLMKDLLRRDFTVNALAMSLSNETFGAVIDVAGGLRDLAERTVRLTYPDSFIEDPARILRAVATQVRLGFTIDRDTGGKAREALDLGVLNVRRNKRAQDEFKEMLAGDAAEQSTLALSDLGVHLLGLPLHRPRPALLNLMKAVRESEFRRDAHPWLAVLLVWLGRIGSTALMEILKDFGLDDRVAEASSRWAAREKYARATLLDASTPMSRRCGAVLRVPPVALSILGARLAGKRHVLASVLHVLAEPPLLRGSDLLELGIHEGRTVGKLLTAIRQRQYDGLLHSRDDAIAFLEASKG